MVRGSLGEVWVYAFASLVFWGVLKIIKGSYLGGFLLTALATGLLIVSHNSISLSFFVLTVWFILIFGHSYRDRFLSFLSLLLGLALSSFYWLVALLERKYTYGDLFMKDLFREHFPSLKQLFLPNITNDPSGQVKDIAVQIGLFLLLALFFGLFLWLQKKLIKDEKRMIVFAVSVLAAVLFLMQPVSIPLWERFSLLRQFQFSWRLLALLNFSLALTGFALLKVFKGKIFFWLLSFLIIISSYFYWFPKEGFEKVNENDFWNYPKSTTYFGEADTIWAAHLPENYPVYRVEVVGGQGEIENLRIENGQQVFEIKAETDIHVLSNTLYFPGWRLFVDGKQKPIQFQDQSYRGLITFSLDPGDHLIKIEFTRTKIRILTELISFASFAFWLGMLMIRLIQLETSSTKRIFES
jgi:hypothetical protein